MTEYSPDKPITTTKEDDYSRSRFASKLAGLLADKKLKENYVLGLYSPWGYGKTSLLGLVIEKLENRAKVLEFNPWVYDNRQTIIASLLVEIAEKLDEDLPKKNYIQRKIAIFNDHGLSTKKDSALKLMKSYTGLLSTGTTLLTATPGVGQLVDKVFALTQEKLKGSTLKDTKLRIEELIQKNDKRIIVFIDDVDRLDKNEIFELFKLIKIIADFKGVTYVVACDDEAVAASLNERFSSSNKDNAGYDFLEKIIQVPLHLPVIDRDILENELFEGISQTLQENKFPMEEDSIQTFRSIYRDQLRLVFKTPRAVKRYLNSIKFTTPLISNEVDPVDFLLLEVFRMFYPTVYSKMRYEKELLTGTKYRMYTTSEEDDKLAKEEIQVLTNSNEQAVILLRSVFPYIEKLFSPSSSPPSGSELRVKRFAASPDYFDRYFSYGIPSNDVSDTEIINMLQLDETSKLVANMKSSLEKHGAITVLRKVRDYSTQSGEPLSLISALLYLGDEFDESKISAYSTSEKEDSVDIIIDIIKSSKTRMPIIRLALEQCSDNEQLFYLIRNIYLGSTDKSNENILTNDELEEFKKKAVNKIKKQTASQQLHHKNSRGSHYLYDYWAEFGSRDEVNQYLKSVINTYEDVIDFVTLYLTKWSGARGTFRGNFDAAALRYINKSIDVEFLAEKVLDKYPSAGLEYPELERNMAGVGKAGNEHSSEFRDILKEQFVFVFKKYQSELENDELNKNKADS